MLKVRIPKAGAFLDQIQAKTVGTFSETALEMINTSVNLLHSTRKVTEDTINSLQEEEQNSKDDLKKNLATLKFKFSNGKIIE